MNSVTELLRTELTDDEVSALRRATRITFRVSRGRAVITATCRKPPISGFGYVLTRLFPLVKGTMRARNIKVSYDLFSRLDDTDVPGEKIASALHTIDHAEQHTAWQSAMSVVRPGDTVSLSFRGNAPGHLPDGWHVDQLVLRVDRRAKLREAEFVVATEIRQGRARMVHLIDPEIVDHYSKEG